MSWTLLVWLISFLIVAALLGMVMYTLISLTDLENDFINPHDSSARINTFVLPEYLAHALLCATFLLHRQYVMTLINVPLLLHHARKFWRRKHLVDVTEIFNQLAREKRHRFVKMGFYLFVFVIIIYRLVEAAVTVLLTTKGGRMASSLLGLGVAIE
eukprot:jgi/Mesvir1/25653/Mv01871-RA.1